jgi:RNase P subunit RPR2
MKSKLSRKETEEKIKEIFSNNPNPKEVKKAKKFAMSKNLKLGNLKKKFCKKCYNLFDSKNSEIKIKKGFKIIKCNCGNISRYKLK